MQYIHVHVYSIYMYMYVIVSIYCVQGTESTVRHNYTCTCLFVCLFLFCPILVWVFSVVSFYLTLLTVKYAVIFHDIV